MIIILFSSLRNLPNLTLLSCSFICWVLLGSFPRFFLSVGICPETQSTEEHQSYNREVDLNPTSGIHYVCNPKSVAETLQSLL